jgi:ABC-type antimicrobial peptide transport system permease subunit
VAVVNEAFAKAYFPGRNPLGEHIGILDGPKDVAIVGVAANARESLKEPFSPFVYISYKQFPAPEWRGMTFAIRTAGDPVALTRGIRRAVHQIAPDVPVATLMTQRQRIESSLTEERIFAQLCSAFAMVALIIAFVGLYASIAYGVSRRTGEIGIRMALGARTGGIVWMVMREALILTSAGLAAGFAGARIVLPAVKAFLFGVKFGDPSVIAWVAGLLLVAALLAGYAPAMRASRIDPMKALRQD